jgi:hypothetical protein
MNEQVDIYQQWRQELDWRLSEVSDEDGLEQLLDDLLASASDDSGLFAESAPAEDAFERVLAGAEAWASLASYAVARFYNPEEGVVAAGAGIRRFAGWSRGVGARLVRLSNLLGSRLLAAGSSVVGATSFSIGASFPLGVSVGLSWPLSAATPQPRSATQQQGASLGAGVTVLDEGLQIIVHGDTVQVGSDVYKRTRLSALADQ